MKNLIVLWIAFAGVTARAHLPQPGSCQSEAHDRTLLDTAQTAELCRDSDHSLPVGCYLDGRSRTVLSPDRLVELCVHATDLSPVDCYLDSRMSSRLNTDEIVRACQAYFTD